MTRHFSQPLLLSAALEIPYQIPLSAFPTKELWDSNWPELQDVQDTKRALLAKGFSVHTCLIRTRDRRRGPVYRSETSPYRVIITPWDRPTGMRSPGRALSVREEARYRPQTPTIWVRGRLDPDRPAWVLVLPNRPLPTTGLLASVLQEVGGVSIRLVAPRAPGSAAATATNRLLRWVDCHELDRRYLTVGCPARISRFLLESVDPSDLLILPASAKPLYQRIIHAPIGETLIQRYPGNFLLVEEAGPLLRSESRFPAIATG